MKYIGFSYIIQNVLNFISVSSFSKTVELKKVYYTLLVFFQEAPALEGDIVNLETGDIKGVHKGKLIAWFIFLAALKSSL